MNPKYEPQAIEADAQRHWRASDAYRAREHDPRFPKGKFYACSMLPYPSGRLHMGHVRNYTINDVLARYKRMQGYNVLMPMGWDAFGLPAENAAIRSSVAPAAWTYENIRVMKGQCQALGLAIDWSRELTTCDPSYYKWNQWMFLKMLEAGIAYRKTQIVNWDPVDQTVLANEQVIDGRGWRSGAIVEKREIPGYYLNITNYAEELLDSTLNGMPGWSDHVRLIQENWLGKSFGVNFGFPYEIDDEQKLLSVYTTRADTIMGATFVAVAAEHPLATRLARDQPTLQSFVDECKRGSVSEADAATVEKTGVPTGFFVTHPLSGEKIEVWIANYVLMGYGEGAVMGVPGHDERDFEFAQKYGLPIRQVIAVPLADGGGKYSSEAWQDWYAAKEHGVCVNSGRYDGLMYEAAVDAIANDLKALGVGDKQVQWRLRDWGISRQRYWGTPIPIVHCADCGVVPVPYEDLPVVLPEHLVPDGTGNPLNKYEPFLNCECPRCGKPARRETDTMDTFVDSAWYYMRYCSPGAHQMVDSRNDYWMPMDQYIGGIEHAVLHLLYARFWTKVMRDMGLVSFDEPFMRLMNHGMLLNHVYYKQSALGVKEYEPPLDVTPAYDAAGHIAGGTLADGSAVEYGGVGKMGKTERNGVDPQDLIDKYGADTARLFVMFVGGPEDPAVWSDNAVEGSLRYLRRVWAWCSDNAAAISQADAVNASKLTAALRDSRYELHAALRQANFDYERMQYNTIVSAAMKMLNAVEPVKPADAQSSALLREGAGILLRTLYPIAPHITFTLWNQLGFDNAIAPLLDAPWPQPAADALTRAEIEIGVQVNGKLRASIKVPTDATEEQVRAMALADAKVARFVEGKPLKFFKVVPGKLATMTV